MEAVYWGNLKLKDNISTSAAPASMMYAYQVWMKDTDIVFFPVK